MAIHTRSDVVIPEVISAEVVTNALFDELPLFRSPQVVDISSSVSYSDGGDHIKLLTREFGAGIEKAQEYVKDTVRDSKTGVDGEKITISSYQENITDKTVPIQYDEYTLRDVASQADINSFLAEVIAESQAATIQDALITKAASAGALEFKATDLATKTLTVDNIAKAKNVWGEKQALFRPGFRPGLFIDSAQWEALVTSSDYKTLSTAATTALVQDEREAGGLAVVHGCVLYLMDSIRKTGDGVTISGITRASQVATVTTDAAHGLSVGDVIELGGATQTEYNGIFTVASVPTSTTFTVAVTGTPATPATGSPAFVPIYESLLLAPGALGLLIKDVETKSSYRFPGTTVNQMDTMFRFITTRFRRKPVPAIKLWTK